MFVARDARGELVNVLEDKLGEASIHLPSLWRSVCLRQGPNCPAPFCP